MSVGQTQPGYREDGKVQKWGHKTGMQSFMKADLTRGWDPGLA